MVYTDEWIEIQHQRIEELEMELRSSRRHYHTRHLQYDNTTTNSRRHDDECVTGTASESSIFGSHEVAVGVQTPRSQHMSRHNDQRRP